MTRRAEGEQPSFSSLHSIVVGKTTIPGKNKESLPFELFRATWNVLDRCVKLTGPGIHKTKLINNPWQITNEPNYAKRLDEIITTIISIIDIIKT